MKPSSLKSDKQLSLLDEINLRDIGHKQYTLVVNPCSYCLNYYSASNLVHPSFTQPTPIQTFTPTFTCSIYLFFYAPVILNLFL